METKPRKDICFLIACCAGRPWWMFHMGILKVEWIMQLSCQPGTWHFSQRHWPAEGLRAAGRANVAADELQGPVWGILASRWNRSRRNRSRIFPIWTGARQLRARCYNYRYGQGPRTGRRSRVLGQRDDSSRAVTLPFPHLFQGRREEREGKRDANRWVSWQERWDGMRHKRYASAPLGFLHNWAYHGMAHMHKRKCTGTLTGMHKSCEQSSCEAKHGNKWAIKEADVKL